MNNFDIKYGQETLNRVSADKLLEVVIKKLEMAIEQGRKEDSEKHRISIHNVECIIEIAKILKDNKLREFSLPLVTIESILAVSTITPQHADVLMQKILDSVLFIGTKQVEVVFGGKDEK